jgi:uncharacterized membrane protein
MKTKTKMLAYTAVLVAVTLLLGLTPIGIITIPGFIEITIMCIPVMVGALTLGWRTGVALGLVFAFASIIMALTRSPLGAILLETSIPKTLLLLIVPRVLVPLAAYWASRLARTKSDMANTAVAAVAGSLTNTIVFLCMLTGMFENMVAAEVLTAAAFINGAIEAVVAGVVCPPIVRAVKKSIVPAPFTQKSKGETVTS